MKSYFLVFVIFVLGLIGGVGERIIEAKHGLFLAVLFVVAMFILVVVLMSFGGGAL